MTSKLQLDPAVQHAVDTAVLVSGGGRSGAHGRKPRFEVRHKSLGLFSLHVVGSVRRRLDEDLVEGALLVVCLRLNNLNWLWPWF